MLNLPNLLIKYRNKRTNLQYLGGGIIETLITAAMKI
jgi:hypothetical protein